MQKIIPHLWFDKEAAEAAEFYSTVFPDSKIISKQVMKDTPSGDCDVMTFEVSGMTFMSISAGPYFKINPSISFFINFDPSKMNDASAKIDEVWNKLAEGGKILMPINKYPFSERFGWVEDKYGVSWQLILTNPSGEERPMIVPSLMFVNDNYGKALEATEFYLSVFKNSKRGVLAKTPDGSPVGTPGNVMFTDIKLEDTWISAMDSDGKHEFNFNEGVSLLINCYTQEEIDYFWEKLSAVPEAEQCGWVKDKYGVSWQINPKRMHEMMNSGDEAAIQRVTKCFLTMKKFDLATLEKAFKGE